MSILSGILNGGFFTGRATAPEGFGNLEALPPIDGTHTPFKRAPEFEGAIVPLKRSQAEKWECEWQPVGTGRPDGTGALAKSRVSEYVSEQLCTPIGDEVEKHKPGYTKVVRIKKKTKQKYNKKYKAFLRDEKESEGIDNRGFVNKAQGNYKYRKTKWPKFENNPTFAARQARDAKKAAAAQAEAAAKAEAAAAKKAAADAKKAAAAEKKAAAPKAPKAPKQAKGKKAAGA